jgi:putative tryptophan/tyrosine transport system substrate-binding protein
MKRREFMTLLSGAVVWPTCGRSQALAMPIIGHLDSGIRPAPAYLESFRTGLRQQGYVEGHNVAIEYRGAQQYDRLPVLAAELVGLGVAVIFATANANSARAAISASKSIPIVFANGTDPVRTGLVASMNRPGGNATGITYYSGALVAKRLQLIREILPADMTIGFLTNPTNVISEGNLDDIRAASATVGQRLTVLHASSETEIGAAFATAHRQGVRALLVDVDTTFNRRREQIVSLAAHYGIVACYATREFVKSGGLMSYGDDRAESHRLVGIYVGRILKGEKPADLPVLQPTKFELVINFKTAKALGLDIPPTLLALADEVIE